MKSSFTTLLSLGLFCLGACQTLPAQSGPAAQSAQLSETLVNDSEVVAVVNTQLNAVDLEQQAAEWGYRLKKKEKLDGLDMYVMTFDCPEGIDPFDAVVELERLQPDASVGVNHKYELNMGDTTITPVSQSYADHLIEWPETGCEAELPIGIIDGGVSEAILSRHTGQLTHRSFIAQSPSPAAIEHGSAITSILMDPSRLHQGQYYVASVVSQDAQGQDFSGIVPMLKALDWMVQSDVKVLNISLAGPNNSTLEKAIKRATNKGMIIVAAVGNDGADAGPRFPAAFENVIAATAVNKNGEIYENAVTGSHVDFSAPGVRIYVPYGDTGKFVSGTSIAAPFVTAMIASHANQSDNPSVSEISQALAEKSVDLGENGKDPVYGVGLIKANGNCSF